MTVQMNTSHELFLLMVNLSQLHNKKKIIELFTEGMAELFKPSSFEYREHQNKRSKSDLEIKTRSSLFGYIETKRAKSLSDENKMLVQNAVQMLAVILEHLDFELRLQDEKLSLEQIANKRLKELQVSVEELTKARKNSLKLIDELNDEIKKRTESEEELQESEERYRLILENSLDAILLTLTDGPIISANRAACEMFDMSEEEICATGRNGIVDPSDENLPLLLEERKKKGKVKGELRFIRKDGSTFPAEITSSVFTLGKNLERTSIIIRDITDRVKSERELRRIEWMLTKNFEKTISNAKEEFIPYYGDLTYLNKSGLILDSVGHEVLKDIANDYLRLLETSSAIYEKNGDYALGLFSSGWCRFMDQASRKLCNTDDNKQALGSGKWLCHESCWKDASIPAMESATPVDIECNGGIRLYALPVISNNEVIGAINFGYGDPPRGKEIINELAEKYKVSAEQLSEEALKYESRPPFIIDAAKERIQASARLIGEIVSRKTVEKQIIKLNLELEQKVKEKTSELAERVAELERFHDATIEREFRIKELRDEIEELKKDQ